MTSNINILVLSAIREGNLNRVRDLLTAYGLSFSKDWADGYKLLCTALEYQWPAIGMLLLDMDCKVNKSSLRPTNTPLHFAACNGDLEIVKVLVEKGAYINTINAGQKTPLHLAIENEKMEIVEFLLQAGANPNTNTTEINESPLHVAVCKSTQIVKLLLDYKADISCTYNYPNKLTPLHLAIIQGKEETVKLLLERGASVDYKAEHDITPLHIAIEKRYEIIAKYLLHYGASINLADTLRGYTALHLAITTGNCELVTLLLQCGANVNAKDNTDKTAIYLAVEKGILSIVEEILKFHPDISDGNNKDILNFAIHNRGTHYPSIVEVLLKYGFSLHIEEKNNYNLLFAAIEKGCLDVVKRLLDHGTNINMLYNPWNDKTYYHSTRQKTFTPLHYATEKNHEKIVELLINYGADVNAKDKAGYPAIFYAIENSDFGITKLLLNNGADILGIQSRPQLLHIAVKKKCKEIIEILLQHGVNVNTVDEHGRTALHFIVSGTVEGNFGFFYDYDDNEDSNVKIEIIKLLLKHQAYVDAETNNGTKVLHAAIEKGHVKMVEILLEHGANVNSRSRKGFTPLHTAVRKGNKVIITKLLDKGAAINATLENGITALHIATQTGHKKIIEILLKYGAQVDSKMERNTTPLHIAAKQGHLDIVKVLLDYGADVNSRNECGTTALHITSNGGHEKIVRYLIDHGCDINIVSKKNYTPLDFAIAANYNRLDPGHDSYEEVKKILKMQIIRLKMANLYVNERNLFLINESVTSKLRHFQKLCEKEIEQMKHEKVENDNISFYDVLTKSEFGIYSKNDNVKQALQFDTYKIRFPIYERTVFLNFIKGIRRKELLEESIECFYCLFETIEPVPYNCTENIFKFICNKDLQYFVDVCKILKTSNTSNTSNIGNTSNTR